MNQIYLKRLKYIFLIWKKRIFLQIRVAFTFFSPNSHTSLCKCTAHVILLLCATQTSKLLLSLKGQRSFQKETDLIFHWVLSDSAGVSLRSTFGSYCVVGFISDAHQQNSHVLGIRCSLSSQVIWPAENATVHNYKYLKIHYLILISWIVSSFCGWHKCELFPTGWPHPLPTHSTGLFVMPWFSGR